jgi:hypothetical protein
MIKGRTAFFAKLSVEGGHEARLLRNNLGRFSVPLTGFTSSVVLKAKSPLVQRVASAEDRRPTEPAGRALPALYAFGC